MIRLAISRNMENCSLAEPWFRLSLHVLVPPRAEGSGGDARHLLPPLVVAPALWLWEMPSFGYRGPGLCRVSRVRLNKFKTWPICSSKVKETKE